MSDVQLKLYLWKKIHWSFDYDFNGNPFVTALCPKQKCNCLLVKSNELYAKGEYKYACVKCDFKITLDKPTEEMGENLILIIDSQKYKDAEIINIDGELVRIQRTEQTDSNYWVDVKLSKNKKGETQLMVLAGDKSSKTKSQLFIDPAHERLAFDQNNDHPTEVFAQVTAIFKKSVSKINVSESQNDN